jgi:hypothetical protein
VKKCLVLILLILTVSSVGFADGIDIGLTGGMDFYSEGVLSALLYGGGLHIGWSTYFNQNIGIGVFFNAGYSTGTIKLSAYGYTEEVKLEFLSGTLLVGPVFNFIESGNFSMPIAVGAFGGVTTPTDFSVFTPITGGGLNVTPQFELSDTMHFFARPQVGFNFYEGVFETILTLSAGVGFTPKKVTQPQTASAPQSAPASQPPARTAPAAPPPAQASQTQAAPSSQTDSNYYISLNRQNHGPYSMTQLQQMVELGILTRETLVWREGMSQWVAAGTLQELASLFRARATPPPL